jgi:alpha-L-fucosidase
MRKILPLFLVLFSMFSLANAQSQVAAAAIREKMEWFADAKLGIFIHAGIYSVKGVDESWSFHNKKISYADYIAQLKGFTLKNYDPGYWAALIQQSGARYAVITTKHHDGVTMYDSKVDSLNIVRLTPAGRDMIQPLFAALRKRGIKCGAYFSLIDWSNHDYPGFLTDSSRYKVADDYARWNRFRSFFQAQIKEVNQLFKPDLWWFDGDWEHSAEEWESAKVRDMILRGNKNAIINGRLQGYGDYETPEQNFPVTRPAYNWWELCMTVNDNWGFHFDDTHWKTPYEIITIFTDVISNGGNLLLDIGPKADGSIPPEDVNVLKELGDWNKRNGEAVFNTRAGISPGHFYGPTTISKDSTTLYLFLQGQISGSVTLKGLMNKINSITVLGNNTSLQHKIVGKISWSKVPGLVYIDLPTGVQDKYVTVLKVSLDGPVKLYDGKGGL